MPVDDAQACIGAFRVLHWMLRNWFADATTTKNSYADQLLQVCDLTCIVVSKDDLMIDFYVCSISTVGYPRQARSCLTQR